jgi:hypothetical protein
MIIRIFIFILFALFILPFSAIAVEIDQSSPESLVEGIETAFLLGDYAPYEAATYYSPKFLEELEEQGISRAEYRECSDRIYIAAHKLFLDEFYAPRAELNRVDVINRTELSPSNIRMSYRMYFLGKTFFGDTIDPKTDESWFIKEGGKWFLDLGAEYDSLRKQHPDLEYCPEMYRQAIDLSQQSGLYAAWVLDGGNEARFISGERSYDAIIASDQGLIVEVSDVVGDMNRYWIHIKNSFPADNLLLDEAIPELKKRLDFVVGLTSLLDIPSGGYYDDIQSGVKQLTLWIEDYTADKFTFNLDRDYLPGEERLAGRLATYSGGRPMVVRVDLKNNTIEEVYNEEKVNAQIASIERMDKLKLRWKIEQLIQDIPNLIFYLFLFGAFAYFLQYLFIKHEAGRFRFEPQPFLIILSLSALVTLAYEALVKRYVELGLADLAVGYLGWPFGLIYGYIAGYIFLGILAFTLSILTYRAVLKDKWGHSIAFAFLLSAFVMISSYLLMFLK